MKKISIICCLALTVANSTYPFILTYQPLKFADEAGMFNRAIIDILRVRQEIKQFLFGKLMWSGSEFNLEIVDQNNNGIEQNFNIIMKRPETLFGASFVVISPNHPQISKFITPQTQNNITSFSKTATQKSLLARYQNPSNQSVNTNLFVRNPITQALMPIFISDYAIENYDIRMTHAHIATPAHDSKDFNFAKANNLPIKLVITCNEGNKSAFPQIDKTTKQLTAAYLGEYSDCLVIESDFLNGSIHTAHEKAIAYLTEHMNAQEYKKPILYHIGNKHYSLKEIQMIEHTLQKENKPLSEAQKELFSIILIQTQADFLAIVEQFLINAKAARELMIEIITESCKLRQKNDAYILKWSRIDSNESEKVIFKRDINNCTSLSLFCSELIDFLEDFASSCPNALANLKSLKNT
jgi:leucyl-tRNA synthetase